MLYQARTHRLGRVGGKAIIELPGSQSAQNGMSKCEFCDELHGGTDNSFCLLAKKLGIDSRMILQTDTFSVFPGLGALEVGYLLIIPSSHITSFSQVREDDMRELFSIVQVLKHQIYSKLGVDCVIFEHGLAYSEDAMKSSYCGHCVDHAHFHVCPTSSNFSMSQLESQSKVYQLSSLEQLRVWKDINYVFYWGLCGNMRVFLPNSAVPSQYLRQRWAAQLNTDEWDWAIFPHLDRVLQTFHLFRDSSLANQR